MRIKQGLAAAAMVMTVPMATMASAEAAPVKTDASVLGTVRIDPSDPSVATVTARYICQGDGGHLWVSVKQAADGRPDKALREEGSSAVANAWVQSHPVDFVCDGTWHTQSFRVDTAEMGFGALTSGQAWVQFCLYDASGASTTAQRFVRVA